MPFELENIGIEFGRDVDALAAFMCELGPGDFDPETGEGTPGDGVLLEQVFTNHRTYRWARHRRKSVAVVEESVASEPIDGEERTPESAENPLDASSQDSGGTSRAILDTSSRKGRHPVRVTAPFRADRLIHDLEPLLEEAVEHGECLYRVSLTMPDWNKWAADRAGRDFTRILLERGATAVLLSKDVSARGLPHWYGFVVMHIQSTPKATRGSIAQAWIAASGADSGCLKVNKVSGWDAYAASGGNIDARVGKSTFHVNLLRAVNYAFKDWPSGFGQRDLGKDVLTGGVLVTRVMSSTTGVRAKAA